MRPLGYTLRRYLGVGNSIVEHHACMESDHDWSPLTGKYEPDIFTLHEDLYLPDDIYGFFVVKESAQSMFKSQPEVFTYHGRDPGYPKKMVGCGLSRVPQQHELDAWNGFIENTEAFYRHLQGGSP